MTARRGSQTPEDSRGGTPGATLAPIVRAPRNGAQKRSGVPPQSEADFQRAVLKYAPLRGWRWWHDQATNAPRRCGSCGAVRRGPRNAPGMLDLILIRRPRLVWAELKAEGGVVSPEQQAWLDDLEASGQEAYLWRPSDWETILRVLA